jgi:hypothetical protein
MILCWKLLSKENDVRLYWTIFAIPVIAVVDLVFVDCFLELLI